jgi:hypothetical protein
MKKEREATEKGCFRFFPFLSVSFFCFSLSLLFLAFGCSTLPASRQAVSLQNGGMSACVYFLHTDWFSLFAHPATKIIWAQSDKFGHLDLDHPILGDQGNSGCLFAVNIPPGTYRPILVSYRLFGLRLYYPFKPELEKEMEVKVKEDRFSFAGNLTVYTATEDPAIIAEHIGLRLKRLWWPFHLYSVKPPVDYVHLDQTALSEAASLRVARRFYANTLWSDAIENRLAEIGDPQSPATQGPFWKRRKVQAVSISSFSYIPTKLRWPRKLILGGAEWLEPKDRARIAVQFFERGMKDYQSQEILLEKMREAGTLDDAHVLFSVHVSTYSGKGVRYKSYVYPKNDLPGSAADVFITETWLIPKGPGYYLIHYRALRSYFKKFYPDFKRFVKYLSLERQKPKKKSF